MKRNVDLTLEREFDKERMMIRKHLWCEECGEPIQIPWKYFCLKCMRFMERPMFRRAKCCWQLRYNERKAIKYSFQQQLRTPIWYYSLRNRKSCRHQLTGSYPSIRRKTFREQLRS